MRVLIVGAGFGGLETAKKLADKPVDVLLIDRNNYHLFTPLLYQVASSLLNASDIAQPIRGIFRRKRSIRFRRATVRSVDLDKRTVTDDTGEALLYDFLVVAAGSTTNYFGLASVEEHAQGLKDLPEALALRNHILNVLEKASTLPPAEAGEWLTFVVVGGGPTGVEYGGALSELIRGVLPHEYPELHGRRIRIVLIESLDEVLPPFRPSLRAAAHRALARKGVEVLTGARVTNADHHSVTLSTGDRIAARTLVWAAGVRPSPLAAMLGTALSKSGRVDVDDFLRIKGHPEAFAIGDIASFVQDGGEVPMLSAPAMQQARVAARNILHTINHEPLERFHYHDKGSMATIGKNAAVAQVGPLNLTGFLGWVAWLTVHLYYIIGFRNRLSVLMGWAWDYIHSDRPIRLITRAN